MKWSCCGGDGGGGGAHTDDCAFEKMSKSQSIKPDMVNHPPHYIRGPKVNFIGQVGEPDSITVECIEVIRHIKDIRLATAMKYIWRVAFGGKDNDREDIEKAVWYLNDWLTNKVD